MVLKKDGSHMLHDYFKNNFSEQSRQVLKYLAIAILVIAYLVLVEGGAPPVNYDLDFPALRIPASWSLP